MTSTTSLKPEWLDPLLDRSSDFTLEIVITLQTVHLFIYSQVICCKNFISEKDLCELDVSIPVPNFNKMWKKPYPIYTWELRNFPVCFSLPKRKFSSLRPDKQDLN